MWGVFLILGAVLSLPGTLWMFGADFPDPAQAAFMRSTQIGYVVNTVVQALAGLAVMVWADRIVALFEADTTALQIALTPTQLQILAFGIAGVFVLADGLQNAAAAGYALYTKPEFLDTASYMTERHGETMASAIVQLLAGAVLVFGREGLATGWARLRQRTSSEVSGEDDDS